MEHFNFYDTSIKNLKRMRDNIDFIDCDLQGDYWSDEEKVEEIRSDLWEMKCKLGAIINFLEKNNQGMLIDKG